MSQTRSRVANLRVWVRLWAGWAIWPVVSCYAPGSGVIDVELPLITLCIRWDHV
jgi:hypothetical protein